MKPPSPMEIWLFVLPLLIVPGYVLMPRGNRSPLSAPKTRPAPTPSPTPAIKWVFKTQHSRVAAGAIASDIHQTVFVVRALNAKGQPLAGVSVEVPELWNVDVESDLSRSQHLDEDREIFPRVQWFSPGKTARTNGRGEVHGLFTSGNRAEPAVMSGPGNTQVQIEQIVNDNLQAFKGSETWTGVPPVKAGSYKTRWTTYLRRGAQILPIRGHRLKLCLNSVTVEVKSELGSKDEKGHTESKARSIEWEFEEPKRSSSPHERANWEKISALLPMTPMKETSPGVYEGTLSVPSAEEIRRAHVVVDGKRIERVLYFFDGIQNDSIYVDEPQE